MEALPSRRMCIPHNLPLRSGSARAARRTMRRKEGLAKPLWLLRASDLWLWQRLLAWLPPSRARPHPRSARPHCLWKAPNEPAAPGRHQGCSHCTGRASRHSASPYCWSRHTRAHTCDPGAAYTPTPRTRSTGPGDLHSGSERCPCCTTPHIGSCPHRARVCGASKLRQRRGGRVGYERAGGCNRLREAVYMCMQTARCSRPRGFGIFAISCLSGWERSRGRKVLLGGCEGRRGREGRREEPYWHACSQEKWRRPCRVTMWTSLLDKSRSRRSDHQGSVKLRCSDRTTWHMPLCHESGRPLRSHRTVRSRRASSAW